jgi:small ligand-binding sensory domain FIST
MPYCYALAQHGTTLATRPFAERLRAEVIEKAGNEGTLELNFEGVLSASHSFADEFVAQLVEDSQRSAVDFDVVVAGAAPRVEARITKALERRDLRLPEFA